MAKTNGNASAMTVDTEMPQSIAIASLPEAALAKLSQVHKLDMKQVEADLWKPEAKDEQLVGVYIGKSPSNFFDKKTGVTVDFIEILVKSEIDGSPFIMRLLEKATLKRVFATLAMNTAVKIVYEGEVPSREGNPTQLYTVYREYNKL